MTSLNLPGKNLLPCMLWADAKGSAFFALENASGVLRRISFPDFVVAKQADLERKFEWLSLSAEGLLLSDPTGEEIWVVDPATFDVKAKIPVPKLKRAVSAPGSFLAVACDQDAAKNQAQTNGKLYVVNLRTKKATQWVAPNNATRAEIGLDNPAMSPDGHYVFTKYLEVMFRFSFKNGTLHYEDHTPRMGRGASVALDSRAGYAQKMGPLYSAGITFSPDSKLVCMPNVSGNVHEKMFTTVVYPINTFNKHQCTLDQGPYPQAVGFDLNGGRIFTQNYGHELLVFSLAGVKKKEYRFDLKPEAIPGHEKAAGSVWQYLVHPDGNKIVMLTSDTGYYVDVPRSSMNAPKTK
ncbi:hypothetical protein FRUB_03474 [Fimbriiglobus ruber]|uniref:Uncharacterized protein n=1 Tax=Fimbriiglobus ruber TaxID=1908690 RepID=A0A225E5C3_9BACT|nr:hypothetical protein FRUB_03474 [Fimbriiglobus ruber]